MEALGYSFRNTALLGLALTHPSLGKTTSNQRLEFLGDAVLGLVITEMLYQLYPNEQEGELARRLASLVRGETLTAIAGELKLGDGLQLSASEAASGGRGAASNLEDALEAIIGAIYLDGGLEAARNFILPHWKSRADNVVTPPKDPKTALQEWAQGRSLSVPSYVVIEQSGPAHAPQFTVEATVEGHAPQRATGANKRAAEQEAAKKLLAILEAL
jgi:ribonuclease-3